MRQLKKDTEEQKKMYGHTASKSNASSHNQSEFSSIGNEHHETMQRAILREKLSADPDLQFENPFIYTYFKKLE
jgi:hypothetical protein